MFISLPSNANIEHLKKQAKGLLKAGRKNQLEAKRRFITNHPTYASGIDDFSAISLQEAQFVIAREYGASSWGTLLEAVEKKDLGAGLDGSGILILTNGKFAIQRLDEAGVPGHKEEWIEVLTDGPVPLTETRKELNQIRARHFESLGWINYDGALSRFEKRERVFADPERYEEVQLWFEHDLYDQLQLIQLIDFLAEKPEWIAKIRVVQFDDFLGTLSLEILAQGSEKSIPLESHQVEMARKVWHRFRQSTPHGLAQILAEDISALPFLRKAMRRLCQEFPSSFNGLGRTESQILKALHANSLGPSELFRINQSLEEAPFLGDSSFFMIVDRLMRGKQPLLRLERGGELLVPSRVGYNDAFKAQRIRLTKTGISALEGQFDRLEDLPAAYWIGGCQIENAAAPRWNEVAGIFD